MGTVPEIPPNQDIVAALIRRSGRLLLVEQQGPLDPAPSWLFPGGRVETGETLLEALEREVREETGLRVEGTPQLAFAVRTRYAEKDWMAYTFQCETSGNVEPNDPDGLILSAAWLTPDDALDRLDRIPWYESSALRRWLDVSN